MLFYVTAIIVCFYKHKMKLDISKIKDTNEHIHCWYGALHTIAVLWETIGHIWHGYEVIGLENIPSEGGALLVYYHGAFPIDLYYITAKCFLYKQRQIRAVGDHFIFKMPGWKLLLEVLLIFPGSITACTNVLKGGDLLFIAPGGVRESLFSDERYHLIWNQRIGFARVAINAQVPIIPVFTQNIREAFRSVRIFQSFFRRIYERFRLPVFPPFGGFPVKLRTIIGKPIEFDATLTAEQLAQKTAVAIQDLIRDNQRIPGSIYKALIDRFYSYPKEKIDLE